jgi:hypothetical protein
VVKLRNYRDTSFAGRIFIKLYFAISPHLIFLFKDIKPLKQAVKSLLDRRVGIVTFSNLGISYSIG